MAMRLNAQMKEQVVKKAIDHTFKKRQKDLQDESCAIGDAAWLSKFGAVKSHINKLVGTAFARKPTQEEIKQQTHLIIFNVGGQTHSFPTTYPLPGNQSGYNSGRVGVITDDALRDRIHAFHNTSETLKSEITTTQATMAAMLKNMQTLERLQTEWPEGKQFYASLPVDFPYQHQVPAVQVKKLNELLGLA